MMRTVDIPAFVRATHLLNIIFLTLLMRSVPQILSSLPKLWWSDDCTPGREWLKFTRTKMPEDELWVSLDEEVSWPSWLVLPGGRRLGMGRHWHFVAVIGWVLTGAVYVGGMFATGDWDRLVPRSWSIFPQATTAITTYLSLHEPHVPAGHPFNALQQLTYFGVVFILGPLAIATGAAMSPAVIARFPWYARLFGGKQAARSIHFLTLIAFVLFTLGHTALVVIHGVPSQFAKIVLGSASDNHALAVTIGFAALALVAGIHIAATRWSIRSPQQVARVLGALADPIQRRLSNLPSRQNYTRDQISPFFRVNGYPPKDQRYEALAADDFRDWKVEVRGLVAHPQSFSLSDLRHMERVEQITKHSCIQGWTAVAAWAGVPMGDLLDRCEPLPEARYAVFYAHDDKTETAAATEEGEGQFYEALALGVLHKPHSILAYEMNGQPLPIEHGAPVRLRIEAQLGIKMVKWVEAIELVADYRHIGQGHGGWREDNAHYGQSAGI